MSVESVDSPRGAVGGGTVGWGTIGGDAVGADAVGADPLADRRLARWARGVLEGEVDRFLFAILEMGVLHRIDRRQVKEDLQNVCLGGDQVVRAVHSRPHFYCLHTCVNNGSSVLYPTLPIKEPGHIV